MNCGDQHPISLEYESLSFEVWPSLLGKFIPNS